jgi:MFS transporter, DHA1 family, staphyloferrin B biosynthesis exporter
MVFFAIGLASARFAIALNVRLAAHHAAAMGSASARLQACQNAMILVAPVLGASLLERGGGVLLFAAAALALAAALAALPWVNAVTPGLPPLPARPPGP